MSQTKENIPPDFYHHKPLKRCYISGIIQDEAWLGRLKIEYVRLLVSEMRLSGYVPRIDIDPDFTIEYTGKSYEFRLSIYGAFVGKRNAECLIGIDKNKPIFTQQNKSAEPSSDQEFRSNQK